MTRRMTHNKFLLDILSILFDGSKHTCSKHETRDQCQMVNIKFGTLHNSEKSAFIWLHPRLEVTKKSMDAFNRNLCLKVGPNMSRANNLRKTWSLLFSPHNGSLWRKHSIICRKHLTKIKLRQTHNRQKKHV
jgi:hypothetical protein